MHSAVTTGELYEVSNDTHYFVHSRQIVPNIVQCVMKNFQILITKLVFLNDPYKFYSIFKVSTVLLVLRKLR